MNIVNWDTQQSSSSITGPYIFIMILRHFTRRGEFSERLMCLNIEWTLYTCRNSNWEQLRRIRQL